jgi:hypothetical protein
MQSFFDCQKRKIEIVFNTGDIAELAGVINQDHAHGVGAWVKASPWALDTRPRLMSESFTDQAPGDRRSRTAARATHSLHSFRRGGLRWLTTRS